MKKLYSFFLFVALSAISLSGNSQCSILTTGTTQTLAITGGLSYTKFSVAYNPVKDVFYTLNGTRIQTHSGVNGTLLNTYYPSYTMRSIWWNPNTSTLEGNGYSSNGILSYTITASTGYISGETVVFSGSTHQPYYQSQGAYDDSNNEILYYYGSSIYRYSRVTGSLIGTISVTGLPIGNITNYNVVYTGCSGKEIGLYDYSNRRLLFINKATGVYVGNSQLAATANTPSSYGVSFADDKLWLSNGSSWTSYKVTNFGLQTSSILGPFCDSSNVSVNFSINSLTFNSGNVFTAQLSDANGNFTSPTNIGSVTDTLAATIAAMIPANTPAGSNYRIRVVSSNPIQTGSDNGTNLVINVPTVNLGANVSICPGDTAYLTAPLGVLSYNWSDGATNQINPVTTAGTYSVTVSNSVCSKSDTIVVATLTAPAPTLSDTASVCANSLVLNPGTFTSYAWSTGATTSTITALSTGNYVVTVTGSNTCTTADTTFANLLKPAITSGDTSICSGDSLELVTESGCYFYLSSISTTNSSNVYSYSSAGDDEGGIAVTPNYMYYTGNSYTARYNADLTSYTSLPVRDGIFSDLSSGDLYTFWNSNYSNFYQTTTYTTNINSLRTMDVNLNYTGSVINLSQTINAGSGSYVFAGSGYVVLWSYFDQHFYKIDLPSGTVTDLGQENLGNTRYGSESWASWGVAECNGNGYSFVYRANTNSLLGTNTNEITRYDLSSNTYSTASSFVNTTLGDMACLTYSPWHNRWYFQSEYSYYFGSYSENIGYASATHNGAGGSGNVNSFAWSTSATSPSITVTPTSSTDYSVTVSHGTVSCSDTVTVTVNALPTISMSDSVAQCNIDSIQITTGGSYSSYEWSTGATTAAAYADQAGYYFVTVSNANGCESSDSSYVNLIDARIDQVDTTICSADSIELNVNGACGLYVNSFSKLNLQSASNNSAGDDRGGIAVTPNYVYMNGDNYTRRFNADLTGGTNYTLKDGIFSDLATGQLYTLWSTAYNNFTSSTTYTTNINAIRKMDASLNFTGSIINLSQTVVAGSGSIMAAGAGYLIIYSGYNHNFYKIKVATGDVEVLGTQNISSYRYGSENWASWGLSECTPDGHSIVFRSAINGNYNEISRFIISTNTFESISTLANLNNIDLASLTYSPWNRKWYFSHEGNSSWWGNNSENILSADADVSDYYGVQDNILWSNSDTTGQIVVSPNTTTDYSVAISRGSQICRDTVSITVIQSPSVTVTDNDLTCYGDTNGSISLAVTGGITPYSYAWSNSNTTSSITGLTGGMYTYSVTGGNNCVITDSVEISSPTEILVNSTINSAASCYGSSDGSATVSVSGGTPNYTYLWPSGSTDSTDLNASGGWNIVTITDSAGCAINDSVYVTAPAQIPNAGPITSTTTFYCPGTTGTLVAANGNNGTVTGTVSRTSATLTPTPLYNSNMLFTFNSLPSNNTSNLTLTLTYTGELSSSWRYLNVYDENNNYVGRSRYYYAQCTNSGTVTLTINSTSLQSYLADGTMSFSVSPYGYSSSYCAIQATMSISYGYTQNLTNYWFASPSSDTTQALGSGANLSIAPTQTTTYYAANFGNGCASDFDSITVIVPPAPLTTYLQNPASICAGETTNISAYGALTYTWPTGDPTISGSGNTATVTPTGTTDYYVTITNAFNCQYVDTMTVTVRPSPVGNVLATSPVSCSNNNDGQAVVYGTGGQAPYTYSWSNGNSGALQLGLGAGNYTVTITDASTCTDTLSVTVGGPASMSFNETINHVSCNAAGDGSISIAMTGGSAPFTYAWSTGATTSSISGLSQGNFSVTVTDNSSCTYDTTFSITEPTALLTGITSTSPETCPGVGNGSITSQTSGGTAPYSYTWDNGGTTAMLTGLNGGTYSLTVTDASGCTATTSGVVTTIPSSLTSSISAQTNVACFNGADGSATAIGTGGASPYVYDWNDGTSGAIISSITAGTYTVTVTDNNSCEHINTVTITEPTQLISTSSVFSNATCFGVGNGSASVLASGGTAGYSYLWPDGSTTMANTALGSGTFDVTITDANSCADTTHVTITEPLELSINPVQTNITCNGLTDGSLATAVTGGTSTYTYLWSNGATASSITGLATGTYTVTVTDANSCQKDSAFTITEPLSMTASINSSLDVTCKGSASGTAEATGNGGSTPYTYLWSNGATTAQNSNLLAGTYSVTVTDANGCNNSTSIVISEPATVFSITMKSSVNVLCNSLNTGSATIEATGGDMPYTYAWSNGYADTLNSGLGAGTYSVSVTDANGCEKIESVTITEPAAMTLNTVASSDVTCFGASNGSATVFAAGGTPSYSYLWSNASATGSISSVGPGTYTLTVTDDNSCTQITSVIITEPTDLTATITNSQNVACNGSSTGFAVVAAGGGTTPYTYDWTTGSNVDSIFGQPSGFYGVTITDGNGCVDSALANLTQPSSLSATISSSINNLCFGESQGAASVVVVGGQSPYNFAWPNGATSSSVSAMTSGNYIVTITDDNNCQDTALVTISEPADLIVGVANQLNPLCFGDVNGEVAASVTGGVAGYTYLWSNNDADSVLTAVGGGTFSLTVTDNNSCTDTMSVTVVEPTDLVSSTNVLNALCNSDTNGSISTTVTGATMPYGYSWSNGDTTANVMNVAAGTFTVTITDANGCADTSTNTVTEPMILSNTLTSSVDLDCYGVATGSAVTATTGGTMPYSFSWTGGQTTESSTTLLSGINVLTVTDANGCVDSTTVILSAISNLGLSLVSVSDISCHGDSTANIVVTATGGSGTSTFSWSVAGVDSTLNNQPAGNYQAYVTDNLGCLDTLDILVTEPTMIVGSQGMSQNPLCVSDANGWAQVLATGGTGSYSYLWPSGDTNAIDSMLISGTHTVTITDSNSCSSTFDVVLVDPQALSNIGFNVTNVSCYFDMNGSIVANPIGGTLPYSTTWSNGQTGTNAIALSVGSYSIQVVDANGCVLNDTAVISSVNPLTPSLLPNDTDYCGSSITLTANPAFNTYNWSVGGSGASVQITTTTTVNFNGLDANGCITYDTVQVNVYPAAIVNLGSDISNICEGTNQTLDAGTFVSYVWSTGDTTQSVVINTSGVYMVTATDANGCQDDDDVSVNMWANPVVDLGSDTVVCGDVVPLTYELDAGTGFSSYVWSTGGTSQTETISGSPGDIGDYSVVVEDGNGCQGTDTVTVEFDVCGSVNEPGKVLRISMYPNPTKGDLTINLNGFMGESVEIEIMTTNGQLMKSIVLDATSQTDMTTQMDLNDLAQGLYFVIVKSGDQIKVERITIY